jgi:hypothetical protein
MSEYGEISSVFIGADPIKGLSFEQERPQVPPLPWFSCFISCCALALFKFVCELKYFVKWRKMTKTKPA